ncbi:piggyBac transposable element-derived protein 4-like [Tachysurus ichikawai]
MLRGIKRIINTAEVAEMQSDPSSDLQDTSTSDTTHSGESDAEFVVAASSYSVDSSTEAEVYSEDSESRGDGYQPPWASHHKKWTEVDTTDLRAYMGLLIFGGIYRSRGESTCSMLRRPAHQREDKLAPLHHCGRCGLIAFHCYSTPACRHFQLQAEHQSVATAVLRREHLLRAPVPVALNESNPVCSSPF